MPKFQIPADFPHPARSGGSDLFRAVLGGTPVSTFARWLAKGEIARPARVGGKSFWPESYMSQIATEGTGKRQDPALS